MLRAFLLFFILFFVSISFAQIRNDSQFNPVSNRFEESVTDTLINRKEITVQIAGKTTYKDYKVIDYHRDSIYVDTTMSIQTYYEFNHQRKDQFGRMSLPNQGQTYNDLTFSFHENDLFPDLGARTKMDRYLSEKDVVYYYVPTPTTELLYRTGMEQGQVAEGIFTFNSSQQINSSISFRGTRSLGHYVSNLSDLGTFRVTSNYHSKNERYYLRAHVTAQDVINQENGGLTDEAIEDFESGDSNFKDRARLETNFVGAESILRGNRYYFDHFYKLWKGNDSIASKKFSHLSMGHIFNYERKHFQYKHDDPSDMYGDAFTSEINDGVEHFTLYNELFMQFRSPYVLGDFVVNISNYDYNYGYDRILINEEGRINDRLDGNVVALGAKWTTDLNKFNVKAEAKTIIAGNLEGYYLGGGASFKLDSITSFYGDVYTHNKSPNLNFLLFQSDYKAFNWQTNFNNEQRTGLLVGISSSKWLDAEVAVTNLDNYTYFEATGDLVKPVQASASIQYLKVKLRKEFRLGKFALDNAFIYQETSDNTDIFPIPRFITRNSLYFSDWIFKGDPLQLQTGITFNYFSKFKLQQYNPVLGEFAVQNEGEYGGYPMFDFFINAQVQRTRMYLLFEHINSDVTGYNYYSAPGVPYHDFMVRFGIVWNFFI
ncbi:MAG: putative porin [Lutimonas sp.]